MTHPASPLRRTFALAAPCALLAAAFAGAPLQSAAAADSAARPSVQYRIVDMGVVGTATASQAFGVSPDNTMVVGRDLGNSGNPAYLWTHATGSVALPNLAGRSYAQANAVNAAGTVVGTSMTTVFGSGALPVMWQDGVVTQFAVPPGQGVGRVQSINASGLAAGSVGSDLSERGALFTAARTTTITATTDTGRFMLSAFGINDAGLVVGSGIDPNNAAVNVALAYDSTTGTMTDIGALPGDNSALAFGVGNAGHVVGSSMVFQGSGRPFIWTAAGGMVAIPLPPATSEGQADAVNSRGWAVGNGGGLYSVPFLYADGKTWPLYALLPPDSTWDFKTNTSASALGITDRGTIVGTAVHDGQTHGYAMYLVRAKN